MHEYMKLIEENRYLGQMIVVITNLGYMFMFSLSFLFNWKLSEILYILKIQTHTCAHCWLIFQCIQRCMYLIMNFLNVFFLPELHIQFTLTVYLIMNFFYMTFPFSSIHFIEGLFAPWLYIYTCRRFIFRVFKWRLR